MKIKYAFDFEEVSVYANVVDLIARHVQSDSIHIDLGCGNASIASALIDRGIQYIGFDSDPHTIERLKERGLEVYLIDLNDAANATAEIFSRVKSSHVKTISMIDVIEHLDNANDLLVQLAAEFDEIQRPFLVLSVPNFAHADVSTKFISGIWHYTETGLLDRTHRVIYTEENLRNLTKSAGWCEIESLDYRLDQTEQRLLKTPSRYFFSGGTDLLIRSIKKQTDPNYNVYQFVRGFRPCIESSNPVFSPSVTLIVTTEDDLSGLIEVFRADDCRSLISSHFQLILSSELSARNISDEYWGVVKRLGRDEVIELEIIGRYILHFKNKAQWTSEALSQAVNGLSVENSVGVFCGEDLDCCDKDPVKIWSELAQKLDAEILNRSFLASSCFIQKQELLILEENNELRAQQLLRIAARMGVAHMTGIKYAKGAIQPLADNWKLIRLLGSEAAYQLFILNGCLPDGLSSLSASLDASIRTIGEIRASSSWRITAPIRFVGYLLRGDFQFAAQLLRHRLSSLTDRLPQPVNNTYKRWRSSLLNFTGIIPNSSSNFPAIGKLVDERCGHTRNQIEHDPMRPPLPANWPGIEISIVTFNSLRWIDSFVESLIALDYPKDRLTICFVDNSSTDGTDLALLAVVPRLRADGFVVDVISRPNNGFGAGHNVAIRGGKAPFCLVTNIDLIFEPSSLTRVVSMALADSSSAVAWELRQKPFEHPKYYDPVTGSTNWNSHACVLLRRSAVESTGGYDETLFMYAEDVEISYRLRRGGYLLRYCPSAVVWHYSYESSAQVKPLQYIGSTFGNLYLRLKYGKLTDIVAVPFLVLRLLVSRQVFPGARFRVGQSLLRLLAVAPKAFSNRRASNAYFPFRTWDYELVREGAFIEQQPLPNKQPLISIITRTYKGRELYLRQALLSGAHQTWDNLEHIVVEDGGDTMYELCDEIARATGRTIRYIANGKYGRSKAGNTGMSAAQGRWCVFLDDDDLLFADHVETLVSALLDNSDAVASYAPALEVVTDTKELAQGSYVENTHGVPAVLLQEFDYATLLHHNYFAIQSVLFERSLFEERGGFEEDMDALEDWLLWLRYAKNNRFVYVPKVTSMFRTPADPEKIKERNDAFQHAYPLAIARSQVNTIDRFKSKV